MILVELNFTLAGNKFIPDGFSNAAINVLPKMTYLGVNKVPVDSWVGHLNSFERLREMDVFGCHVGRQSSGAFWYAVSQLARLNIIGVDIPLPRNPRLRFPQLTHLELKLSRPSSREYTSSIQSVFTQMPSLEDLNLSFSEINIHQNPDMDVDLISDTNVFQIPNIICTKLKFICIAGPLPKGLVAKIAQQNSELQSCCFASQNIDDIDLLYLSNRQDLHYLYLRTEINIDNGLVYLADLPGLVVLWLYHSNSKHVDSRLIRVFLPRDSLGEICFPRLEDHEQFELQELSNIFGVDPSLHPYIETPDSKSVHQYVIRLDLLRESGFRF